MSKRIIVSVISDIVTDQRVQKECNTLHKTGYTVLLLGRKRNGLLPLDQFPYKIVRFGNLFRRGPLMYLMFNIQLFFYLLFKKADILWANDLDTLLPNFIIARLKGMTLVYDSHEYFTASVYKKASRKVWELLEKLLLPHLHNVITVSESIKKVYEEKYRISVKVVRNVPYKFLKDQDAGKSIVLPPKKILIMQGIGLNENRGAEEAVATMQFLPDTFRLYFIGGGTILQKLKHLVYDLNVSHKVTFIDTLPYHEMMKYTQQGFLGLIFEKIYVSDQHMFALPNKLFDYIHAGIPVLSSEAVEIKSIIEKYHVGDFINSFEPHDIAKKITAISENAGLYESWKKNTAAASEELNWQNEEKIIISFMDTLK